MSYVVLAELRARSDRVDEFAALMERHAERSAEEPGCLAFDVLRDPDDASLFVLYEVYADESAYLAHRATGHYRRFRSLAPDLLDGEGELPFVSRRVLARN